jgi:hypothetical protein
VDALIRVADNAGDELALLSEWLRDEEELRGRVKIVHGPVRDTELGPVPELLSVALGAGGAGTVLASSLISWIRTRRTTAKITVESAGYSVTLDIQTVGNAGPLLGQILRAGDDGQAALPSPAAARTDEPRARRILGDAIQAGQMIPDEMHRTRALTYVAVVLAATDPDRAERLARSLSSVNEPQHRALAEVAGVLAATDPDRAERLARSIANADIKASALASVAQGMAAAHPVRAERLAQSITEESSRSWALESIAPVLAATDPDRAERLAQSGPGLAGVARVLAATDPDRAERLAQWTTHESVKASVLANVAVGLAATDPDRAERLAQSITGKYARPQALARVAGAMAATDPDRAERLALSLDDEDMEWTLISVVLATAVTDPDRAERVAQSITIEMKAYALAAVAQAVAATDPQRAARLSADAERVVQSMTDDPDKAEFLGILADRLALADPDRAERLAADAERLAQSITDEPSKASVLERVARSLAVMDPDRAERLVHSITGPNERTLALATIADTLIHGEDRQMAPSSSIVVLSLLTRDAGYRPRCRNN